METKASHVSEPVQDFIKYHPKMEAEFKILKEKFVSKPSKENSHGPGLT